jgi:large subunit ribosomal protein L13
VWGSQFLLVKPLKIKAVDTLSYKTVSLNAATVKKEWVVIDAMDLPLGRLASRVALILRGKNKPGFTPNVDCGDNVIVVNCEKVALKGKKMTNRVYTRYTGYPGGQRFTTPKEILAKRPEELIRRSVRGMLPKNRLGSKILDNLYIYAGPEHPHQAQQPTEITLKEI